MADLATIIQQLSQVRVYDYFKRKSMPEFVEPLVSELVASFASYSGAEKNHVLPEIPPEVCSILGWYARKLAGRAVRETSIADLWNGLLAVAILANSGDVRDAMAPLALLYNSALRLREDPNALFEAASEISIQPVGNLLNEFLRRPADLKSIETFGFAEGLGPLGFDYVPLLPEYGGPTPF